MSHYLIDAIEATPQHRRAPRTTEVVGGAGDGRLERLSLARHASGPETDGRPPAALFVLIGAGPRTDWLPAAVERDQWGYVLTGADVRGHGGWPLERPPLTLETSVPGVFAVGDVRPGVGQARRLGGRRGVGRGRPGPRAPHGRPSRRRGPGSALSDGRLRAHPRRGRAGAGPGGPLDRRRAAAPAGRARAAASPTRSSTCSGSTTRALLAGARRGRAQRGARLRHLRGGRCGAATRALFLVSLAFLSAAGLPRAARAGDARRAARHAQRRVRRWRRRSGSLVGVGASPPRRPRTGSSAARPRSSAADRCCVALLGADGRVGGALARAARAVRRRTAPERARRR